MTQMAEFWVAVAFVVFLLILLYYKVPKLIAKSLDDRAEAIRKELDEARRLREEAQNLLADYQKKHRNVGQEADAILEQARREAEAFAHETRAGLKDTLERRTQAGRGQDRAAPRRRRSTRCGPRPSSSRMAAAEKILREKTAGAGGAAAHRPEHPRPQGPAELTSGTLRHPGREQSAQVASDEAMTRRGPRPTTCVGPLLRLTLCGSVSGRCG